MKIFKEKNPFLVMKYHSPEYFCDREEETRKIINAFDNGRNLSLIALRRIGKTDLIHNVFYHLSDRKKTSLVYFDVYPLQSTQEFVEAMGSAVIKSLEPAQDKMIDKVARFLTNFRPVLSIDSLTGQPNLNLKIVNPEATHLTLDQVFNYISSQENRVLIAIDEFQQLAEFDKGSIIALIRSWSQRLQNVNFIFSGSSKHMLMNIFVDPKGIFYRSADIMYLEPIDRKIYAGFIYDKFAANDIIITDEALDRIFVLTRGHTYFVQYLCNRLYEKCTPEIGFDTVNEALLEILKENETVFFSIKKLLTDQQWLLLKSIARETRVNRPTSREFILRYNLPAASSVSLALKALLSKDMIYEENGYYYVYDVFLSEWIKRV